MSSLPARLREAVRHHDEAVDTLGVPIWIGAEPTFTLRDSLQPAWLSEAEGADKEPRARALLLALAPRLSPAPVVMRCAGRRYPGEARPRFSYGAFYRRDGLPVWNGPPDPMQCAAPPPVRGTPQALRDALAREVARAGGSSLVFDAGDFMPRLALRSDGGSVDDADPRLWRPGAHAGEEAPLADRDPGAPRVFAFDRLDDTLAVELPHFDAVAQLLEALALLEQAAAMLQLPALVLRGYPPAVDARVAWLTVTPDPGVIEVNLAPAPDLATFAHDSEAVFAAAADAGLSAERLHFNGQATDSGGGGQLTFGGPSPRESPFLRTPGLLTGLVRTVNRHPSLSYLFAMDCLGSGSQGPRPDEGVRERFEELAVTLDRLDARGDRVEPEELWSALAPLLADCSGNTHRAELNVEKLWNPGNAGRGRSGLVELRALRMQAGPTRQVAVAALFRALLARLARADSGREPLVDWGAQLHDRFALPWFLEQDLREVLADLRAHGLGLRDFEPILLERPAPWARLELGGASLELTPALEFWPLLGDVASQEQRGARLFDSSCARLQVLVRAPDAGGPGAVGAAGFEVPLVGAGDAAGATFVAGLRYRAFAPRPGLHPGLAPHDPLRISWSRAGERAAVELHRWRPSGGSYPGLPADAAEAARRRSERVVRTSAAEDPPLQQVPRALRSTYCLDLRRLAGEAARLT